MSALQNQRRYDPNDHARVFDVEHSLRRHVESVMSQSYGTDWIARAVHPRRADLWSWRQRKAKRHGEHDFPLIAYSDFPDLKDIIVQAPYWYRHFARGFGDKATFVRAMDCIYTIRTSLAHSRPISAEQRRVLECACQYINDLLEGFPSRETAVCYSP